MVSLCYLRDYCGHSGLSYTQRNVISKFELNLLEALLVIAPPKSDSKAFSDHYVVISN
jgi:hypothetical protein